MRWIRTWIRTMALLAAVIAWPAAAHDPYTGMISPEGLSCCNNRDCAPAQECYRDRQLGFLWQGQCVPLLPDRYVHAPGVVAADPRIHVCLGWLNGYPLVRCWTGPLGL